MCKSASPSTLSGFPRVNAGYDSVFQLGRLSVGLVVPIEAYPDGPRPSMERHVDRALLAEELGFAAVWLRDVPFDVPSFGDAGQLHDPFVYLGLLAGRTTRIALGVASVILPIRHPAHVAKAAASADVLSGGRLILGVASGDRPDEYPALGMSYQDRGARFREALRYIERMSEDRPAFDGVYGSPRGIDMLPKPTGGRLPMLITGSSQQTPEWIASHGDGWMTYPRDPRIQARAVAEYRDRVSLAGRAPRPVMQPLYVDLVDDPDAGPSPIHLGVRTGVRSLVSHLKRLELAGVNHVAINLRFNHVDVEKTLRRLAAELLPSLQEND